MGKTKRLLQRRLEHWKSAAAQLIGGPDEIEELEDSENSQEVDDRDTFIKLEPAMLERCKQLAEAQRTTVSVVVHQMIEQYWSGRNNELVTPISREQSDRNPLLQLDALSKRNFRPFGEAAYAAE